MADILKNYVVGDALEEAVDELRMTLIGNGHVSIGVHNITRDNFDRVAGEERYFSATPERREFWSKRGFNWSNDRHRVYVNYFTDERPVVVPLAPQGLAADANPPYGNDRGPNEVTS